jgi:hypothetical protein
VEVTINFRGQTEKAVEGTDYMLAYTDNVDANAKRDGAQACVTVKGIGVFQDAITLGFDIAAKQLNDCEVKGQVYASGEEVRPELVLYDPRVGYELTEGVDYRVQARNSPQIHSLTPAVYLSGVGNYTGIVRVGFGTSKGTSGGSGGGDGTGRGSGSGAGFGVGEGLGSGEEGQGSGSGKDVPVTLSLDDTVGPLSEAGIRGGGGGSGGRFAILQISHQDVELHKEFTTKTMINILLVLIFIITIFIAGGLNRARLHWLALGGRGSTVNWTGGARHEGVAK